MGGSGSLGISTVLGMRHEHCDMVCVGVHGSTTPAFVLYGDASGHETPALTAP